MSMDNEKVFNTDEYGPDIVSVVDEEGVEHTFEELALRPKTVNAAFGRSAIRRRSPNSL